MTYVRKTLAAAGMAALCLRPALGQDSNNPAFSQGLADRGNWERWVGQQTGDTLRGATYWSAQRSLPKPGSCYGAAGRSLGDFTAGCVGAQQRIGPYDNRRRTEPDYRAGWNSYKAPDTTVSAASDQLGACRAINEPSERLRCYDVVAGYRAPSVPFAATQPAPARTDAGPSPGDRGQSVATQAGPAIPRRDPSAAAWLNDLAPHLFRLGRADTLVRECTDEGLDASVPFTGRFNAAVATLPAADAAFANRVFGAGQEDGNNQMAANGRAACRLLTPTLLANVEAILSGHASFWDDGPLAAASVQPPTAPVLAPAPAPAPIPQALPSGLSRSNSLEADFLATLDRSREAFEAAPNDLAKGATRPERARLLCKVLPDPNVFDWRATVEWLSSSGKGEGVVQLRIGPDVTVGTLSNGLIDMEDETLIPPGSPLMQVAAGLTKGQPVRFSGRFVRDPTDCFKEKSLTQRGSMEEPDFALKITQLEPDDEQR